jgi:membrane-associated phospholipid phosphatase
MRRLLTLTVLLLSAIAAADDTVGQGAGPPTGANGSGGAPASGSDAVDIAKPAPDAPPQKVEQAKQIAKTAALTPIVPNPGNPTKPAYQLYAEIDPPIVATGLVFMLGRRVRITTVSCGAPDPADPVCPTTGLNSIDKTTAGYYSKNWSTYSDIGLYSLYAGTAGILLVDEGPLNALNDAVVVGEATLSSTAVASIMTLAAGRPRPLTYSNKAPLSVRKSPDADLSFISSHTSMSFSIVTSLFITEHRLHPTSNKPYYLLGGGMAIASFVALARVESGYHFITDVIGGAVVGTSIGVLVSSVHSSPVHVVPVVNHDAAGNLSGAGLGLSGDF